MLKYYAQTEKCWHLIHVHVLISTYCGYIVAHPQPLEVHIRNNLQVM